MNKLVTFKWCHIFKTNTSVGMSRGVQDDLKSLFCQQNFIYYLLAGIIIRVLKKQNQTIAFLNNFSNLTIYTFKDWFR